MKRFPVKTVQRLDVRNGDLIRIKLSLLKKIFISGSNQILLRKVENKPHGRRKERNSLFEIRLTVRAMASQITTVRIMTVRITTVQITNFQITTVQITTVLTYV
jgi:hypothetical protein